MSKSKTAVHKIPKLHPAKIYFTAIMEGPIFFFSQFSCVLMSMYAFYILYIQVGHSSYNYVKNTNKTKKPCSVANVSSSFG